MNATDEIKSRLSIVDVVSWYRPLVRAGKNFKCLCPFHDDHSPSMMINPSQNFAWCFACQNGGDIFSFVQKMESLDFRESLVFLAEKANVSLETEEFSAEKMEKTAQKKEEKDRVREVLLATQKFFEQKLSSSKDAQKYWFETRQFLPETAQKFGFGFAPNDFHQLENFLLSQNFSRKEMLLAGVVSQKEDNAGEVYDKFRNRVMFPVLDTQGKICGFGGRILGDGEPKYLNSPETLLYKKSHILFGFSHAREKIRAENAAILMEGNLDVITAHQCGVHNAVASSGTAFSVEHSKLLKRFCSHIFLAFDNDKAGQDATIRSAEILLSENLSVRVVEIPFGKDPDDALRQDKEKFLESVKNAKTIFAFVAEKMAKNANFSTPEGKKLISENLSPLFACVRDPLEKEEYFKEVASVLQMDTVILKNSIALQKNFAASVPKKEQKKEPFSALQYFFGLLFVASEFAFDTFQKISPDFFLDLQEKWLYEKLQCAYNTHGVLRTEDIFLEIDAEQKLFLQQVTLYASDRCGHFPLLHIKQELEKLTITLGKQLLEEKMRHCTAVIRKEPTAENIAALQEVQKKLHTFHKSSV